MFLFVLKALLNKENQGQNNYNSKTNLENHYFSLVFHSFPYYPEREIDVILLELEGTQFFPACFQRHSKDHFCVTPESYGKPTGSLRETQGIFWYYKKTLEKTTPSNQSVNGRPEICPGLLENLITTQYALVYRAGVQGMPDAGLWHSRPKAFSSISARNPLESLSTCAGHARCWTLA